MKFDFCIGNPPYQIPGDTNNKAEAIYHHFYNASEMLADKYILISPARFLFNAGLTPKEWNGKMLSDPHVKVETYIHDSSDVFPNTNITGGVVIIYRDKKRQFPPIENFIPDDTFRMIASRFSKNENNNLSSITYGGRSDLKFNENFIKSFPNTKETILQYIRKKHPAITELGPNEEYEIKSSAFERTPYAFYDKEPDNPSQYYKILGLEKGQRTFKWIRREFLSPRFPENNNIESFKVFISNADGAAGQIGKPIPARILGKAIIGEPGTSSIPTFMSIGNYSTLEEAINTEKYLKTRLVRTLVGILKISQHITPTTFSYVPMQDFSSKSDIDWNVSIPNIDKQLYKKYGLSLEEIEFIEAHVKEME